MLSNRLGRCAEYNLWTTLRTWLSFSFFRCLLPYYLLWLDSWVLDIHLSSLLSQSRRVLNVSWTIMNGAIPSTTGKILPTKPICHHKGHRQVNGPKGGTVQHCRLILQVSGMLLLWGRVGVVEWNDGCTRPHLSNCYFDRDQEKQWKRVLQLAWAKEICGDMWYYHLHPEF